MPRSPSRNDRDRRDRDRYRPKDHSNDVAKMKEKMRNNLESARNSQNLGEKSRKTEKYEEMTAAEQFARSKAIQEIEEGGFQPGSFRSGSTTKKDQKSKKDNSHDSAIFGPTWKSAEQRKAIEKRESDVSTITLPTAPAPPMNAMAPMIPSHMHSEHSTTRKAEWKTYWSALRQEMLLEGH